MSERDFVIPDDLISQVLMQRSVPTATRAGMTTEPLQKPASLMDMLGLLASALSLALPGRGGVGEPSVPFAPAGQIASTSKWGNAKWSEGAAATGGTGPPGMLQQSDPLRLSIPADTEVLRQFSTKASVPGRAEVRTNLLHQPQESQHALGEFSPQMRTGDSVAAILYWLLRRASEPDWWSRRQ